MRTCAWLVMGIFAVAALVACGDGRKAPEQAQKQDPPNTRAGSKAKGEGHSHVAPHGGAIQSVENYHFEVVYDAKNGGVTLYLLGEEESKAVQTEAQAFKAQTKVEGFGDLFELNMRPIPLEGEKQGESSRFYGALPELMNAKSFEVVFRIPVKGRTYRSTFQIVPGEKKEIFVCAMGCEKDKVYYEVGKCPVCKMDLVHPKEAHADHTPKHGGQFFMAPDLWHHLEGVLASPQEIRIYFYNNFTKPIPAKNFAAGSVAEIVRVDSKKNEIGKPAKATFALGANDEYLVLAIPDGMELPLSVTARVKFEGKDRPEVFSFDFDKPAEILERERQQTLMKSLGGGNVE